MRGEFPDNPPQHPPGWGILHLGKLMGRAHLMWVLGYTDTPPPGTPTTAPRVIYRSQVEQLRRLGFDPWVLDRAEASGRIVEDE